MSSHDGEIKMSLFTREEKQIINQAKKILLEKSRKDSVAFTSPNTIKEYLLLELAAVEHEVFGVVLLDNQHRLIGIKKMFNGTIDSASVFPREVAKVALKANAAAIFIFHNHPSGCITPSNSDRLITERLTNALGLIDIRILDHFIVGLEGAFSFAENNMM